MYKPIYFKPEELVGQDIYDKYIDKDIIYELFDENLLRIVDLVRIWAGVPLTINNWKIGGLRKESGLRDPNTSTGAPNSPHKIGKAVDMISNIKSVNELWDIINIHEDELPCNIRIEKTSNGNPITWLHIDTNAKQEQQDRVYYFNA